MKLGALSAIILQACERAMLILKQGLLDLCIIQGTEGKYITMGCGTDYILVTVFDNTVNMEHVFTRMRETVERILEVIAP
jgi:predicted regulator of Ras-like GTPase activity (Roadblock/LC7/MglB family)